MSVAFGRLNSFADFHRALQESLTYAESPDFFYPNLKSTLRSELLAAQAWTAEGRRPLLAERLSPNYNYALFRTRDGSPIVEPPEHEARLNLARLALKLFREWPRSEEELRRGTYSVTVGYPKKPTPEEIGALVPVFESALASSGFSAARPPESAFQSKQPFFRDTLTFPQWIQWVLVPRLREVAQGTQAVPASSQLVFMALPSAETPATWPLLYAIGKLDSLFQGELPGFTGMDPNYGSD